MIRDLLGFVSLNYGVCYWGKEITQTKNKGLRGERKPFQESCK